MDSYPHGIVVCHHLSPLCSFQSALLSTRNRDVVSTQHVPPTVGFLFDLKWRELQARELTKESQPEKEHVDSSFSIPSTHPCGFSEWLWVAKLSVLQNQWWPHTGPPFVDCPRGTRCCGLSPLTWARPLRLPKKNVFQPSFLRLRVWWAVSFESLH